MHDVWYNVNIMCKNGADLREDRHAHRVRAQDTT